jgi:hypothetical protein
MRHQHDEIDAIRSQVEQLLIQRVPSPLRLVNSPSSSGSSPTATQSRIDLNQPAPEEEMEDEDSNHLNHLGS